MGLKSPIPLHFASKGLQYSIEGARPQVQTKIRQRTKEDSSQPYGIGLGAGVGHGGLHRGGDT